MIELQIVGLIATAPTQDEVEGGRELVIQMTSEITGRLRIPKDIAHETARKLTMPDDELMSELLQEQQAEQVRNQIIVPGQNGQARPPG